MTKIIHEISAQYSAMSWIKISLSLCTYGLLKEFRPSESYVVPYLLGPRMNFTEEEVRYILLINIIKKYFLIFCIVLF